MKHWLASADEANLVLDHDGQVNVFLVAGLLTTGGFVARDGGADVDLLRNALRDRIAALPALNRTVESSGRRHHWLRTEPDLNHHIRIVDRVDGVPGLAQKCGELMTLPLALNRPLWEILLVPGAVSAGTGVVLRIHHAVADGMAAVRIVQQLFDHGPAPAEPDHPREQHGASARPARTPQSVLLRLLVGANRIRKTLRSHDVGATMLLGERGPLRGVTFVRADLQALETRARGMGATVNDALLAAVASGFRAALPAAGEQLPVILPVSVPVALRRRGTAANQVGVMLVRLPVGEPDPDERLRRIAAQTRLEKVAARDQGTLELMRGPIGARIMDRLARRQRLVAGFVTNVPGPARTLRLAGAPVDRLWPVAVLAGNVRLGVAAISYDGGLYCGIHFDATNVPGAEFSRAFEEDLARGSSSQLGRGGRRSLPSVMDVGR